MMHLPLELYHGSAEKPKAGNEAVKVDGSECDPFGPSTYFSASEATAAQYAGADGVIYKVGIEVTPESVAYCDHDLLEQAPQVQAAFSAIAGALIAEIRSVDVSTNWGQRLRSMFRPAPGADGGDRSPIIGTWEAKKILSMLEAIERQSGAEIEQPLMSVYGLFSEISLLRQSGAVYKTDKKYINELLVEHGVHVLVGAIRAEHVAGSKDEGTQYAVLNPAVIAVKSLTLAREFRRQTSVVDRPEGLPDGRAEHARRVAPAEGDLDDEAPRRRVGLRP